MSNIRKEVLDKIEEEVLTDIQRNLKNVLIDAVYEIEFEYKSILDMWYNSYSPKKYSRTYGTYYGLNKYDDDNIEKYITVERQKDGIYGKAEVIVDKKGDMLKQRIGEDNYHDSVDYVFSRTWEQGIHGTFDIGHSEPPPEYVMDQWFDNFMTRDIYSFIRKHGL